jgi:zinc protease
MEAELNRLREDPISDDELEQAKAEARGRIAYANETVEGRARRLALFESLYGSVSDDTYGAKIQDVTANDVKRAAVRYLTPLRYGAVYVGPRTLPGNVLPDPDKITP